MGLNGAPKAPVGGRAGAARVTSGVEWSSAQMHTSTCVRHESRSLVSNEAQGNWIPARVWARGKPFDHRKDEGSYGQGASGAVKAYTPPSREPAYTTLPVTVKDRMPEK